MATRTKTIADLLRQKRAGGAKAPIYRRLHVSPQTYDAWEAGMYVPSPEHGTKLAEYLEMDEREVAWLLYVSSKVANSNRAKGLLLDSMLSELTQPVPALTAA